MILSRQISEEVDRASIYFRKSTPRVTALHLLLRVVEPIARRHRAEEFVYPQHVNLTPLLSIASGRNTVLMTTKCLFANKATDRPLSKELFYSVLSTRHDIRPFPATFPLDHRSCYCLAASTFKVRLSLMSMIESSQFRHQIT